MVATLERRPDVAVGSRFVWFDLMSIDRAASLRFFRAVLGWEVADDVPGAYATVLAGGRPLGGVVQLGPEEGHPSHFVAYVGCDDVDDLAARAHGLGGGVAYAPVDVPGVGRIALLTDPLGTTVAALTAAAGTSPDGEPDPPLGGVAWRELVTACPARAGAFYARLFGWAADDAAGAEDSTVLRAGDSAVGGLACPAEDGTAAGWLHSFLVADIDAAAALVVEHGGRMRGGTTTIPHDGRFARATDPTGAMFALFQALT